VSEVSFQLFYIEFSLRILVYVVFFGCVVEILALQSLLLLLLLLPRLNSPSRSSLSGDSSVSVDLAAAAAPSTS